LVTGIAAGEWVKVQRITPSTTSYVTFQASSLLTAEQLNSDTLFNTYLNQEGIDQGDQSSTTATAAAAAATAATTAATTATSTANTAAANASTALAQSNSALADSATALSQSTTALSQSTSALSASATAVLDAAAAVTTANAADAKADSAITAISTSAVFTPVANVAAIPASPSDGESIQVTDATGIESFTPLANLPGGFVGDSGLAVRVQYSAAGATWNWFGYFAVDSDSRYIRSNGSIILADGTGGAATPGFAFEGDTDTGVALLGANEIGIVTNGVARLTFDSTGSGTFTSPVTIPAGSTVTGYLDTTTAASTYLTQASAASTYQTQAGMSSYVSTSDIGISVQGYDADTVKQDVLPTFTVATRTTERTITSGAFDLSTGNLWTVGAITVPNPTNAVSGQTGAIRITAGPVVWSSNFKFPGGTAPTIATFPAIIPYYVQNSSTILMGNVVEGIA
jgi:hypothetical protein